MREQSQPTRASSVNAYELVYPGKRTEYSQRGERLQPTARPAEFARQATFFLRPPRYFVYHFC
jgi:hypothetical protein